MLPVIIMTAHSDLDAAVSAYQQGAFDYLPKPFDIDEAVALVEGPDLSNIGNRQPSNIWHYIHLYNPRAVVKNSIMQAYPWYFKVKENPDSDDVIVPIPEEHAPSGGSVVATQDAKDIVAYLLSLKQTPLPGKPAEDNGSTGIDITDVSKREFLQLL